MRVVLGGAVYYVARMGFGERGAKLAEAMSAFESATSPVDYMRSGADIVKLAMEPYYSAGQIAALLTRGAFTLADYSALVSAVTGTEPVKKNS